METQRVCVTASGQRAVNKGPNEGEKTRALSYQRLTARARRGPTRPDPSHPRRPSRRRPHPRCHPHRGPWRRRSRGSGTRSHINKRSVTKRSKEDSSPCVTLPRQGATLDGLTRQHGGGVGVSARHPPGPGPSARWTPPAFSPTPRWRPKSPPPTWIPSCGRKEPPQSSTATSDTDEME